jgi:hypothetical protein
VSTELDFPPARAPAAQHAWETLLRPLAADLEARMPEVSAAIVASIRDEFPELFVAPGDFEENRVATAANVGLFLRGVVDGLNPDAVELPAPVRAYAREAVRRGVPLGALLRRMRLGHAALWRICLAGLRELAAEPEELAEAAGLLSDWLFAYVDAVSTLAESAYVLERDHWLRSAAAVQTDVIDAILARRDVDAASAGRRLRYELEREHVGVVAWLDAAEEGRDTLSTLEAAITDAATRAGLGRPLVQPLGLLAAGAWLGAHAAPGGDALDALAFDPRAAPGVRLAVGEPGRGLAGFRRTHEQALHARRVATLARRAPGTVTRYGRVALSALATVDPEQAHAFVVGELGRLAGGDDLALRLAATLRTYLDEGASHSRAAARLGIHENTVRYRVRQAETLLGHRVDARRLELRVALALAGVVRDVGTAR